MLPKDFLNRMIEAYKELLSNSQTDEEFSYYERIVEELENLRDTGKLDKVNIKVVRLIPINMSNFSEKKRQN